MHSVCVEGREKELLLLFFVRSLRPASPWRARLGVDSNSIYPRTELYQGRATTLFRSSPNSTDSLSNDFNGGEPKYPRVCRRRCRRSPGRAKGMPREGTRANSGIGGGWVYS